MRKLEIALQFPVENSDNSNLSELKDIFEKSLTVNKDLLHGIGCVSKTLKQKNQRIWGRRVSKRKGD